MNTDTQTTKTREPVSCGDVKVTTPNGIPNKGNTCYMNAAFQTIIDISSDIFISGEYNKKVSADENIKKFVSNFAHLSASVENIDGRWSKTHVNLYLQDIFNYLGGLDNFKRFIKYRQADSYEFLAEFIDLLSSYLRYKISIDISVNVDEKDLDKIDKIRLVYYNHLKLNLKYTSVFEERLRGYFRASITCGYEECKNRSEKFEPFLTLSLPIEGMDTLEECLENYVKPITLDENNQWYCDKCKRKSQAEKKLSIWNTGEYVIISYKRYSNIQIATIKDGRSIIAPFQNLDLSPYVEDNNSNENKYSLCSVTVHSGNMNSGHYVIARKMKNNWFVFNDSTVIPVKESEISTSTAYYLVYKRQV
jgi:ubiquitin C-terminal hydrolase